MAGIPPAALLPSHAGRRAAPTLAMNWLAYQVGVRLARANVDFYALVIAAMMRADSMNAAKLRSVFPELWDETQSRYNAPGGLLEGETMTDGMRNWLDTRRPIA